MQTSPILIIGGGVGGLTLALSLAKRGVACQVFEQSAEFSEFGAGIQLSPNAIRRLKSLGLEDKLAAFATAPDKINIHDSIDGAELSHIPLGAMAEARYGAPYRVIARQHLISLLLEAVSDEPLVELFTNKRLLHLFQDGQSLVKAVMEDESVYEGALLIGADGVWSRVRTLLNRQITPTQTGLIAWRALLPERDAPALLSKADTNVWLGPAAHLVQYRVAGGEKINLVAVTKGEARPRSWAEDLPAELLFEQIRGWHKPVRRAVMEVGGWQAWPLMLLKPFRPWFKGRAVLMGDACHAIVPFLAQGAAMAIEDAVLLADLIANSEDINREDARDIVLTHYEAERYRRCRRVLSKSIYNLQFYHAKGALRHVRNGMLRFTPPKFLLRQYDWLYKE